MLVAGNLVDATITTMDSLDERLIDLLSRDPRQSSETLATQLHLSPSTVRRRIQKLSREGILRFVAIAEPSMTGFPLRAIIGFDVAHEHMAEVMEALAVEPRVKALAATTGQFDVVALMWFASTEDLYRFMQDHVSNMRGVQNTETFICLYLGKGF